MNHVYLFNEREMELPYFISEAKKNSIRINDAFNDDHIGILYDKDKNEILPVAEGDYTHDDLADNLCSFSEFGNLLNEKSLDSAPLNEDEEIEKAYFHNLEKLDELDGKLMSQMKGLETIENITKDLTPETFTEYEREIMSVEFYGILLGDEYKEDVENMKELARKKFELKKQLKDPKFRESRTVDNMMDSLKDVTSIVRNRKRKEELIMKAATDFGVLMQSTMLGDPTNEDKKRLDEITAKLKEWNIDWIEKGTGKKIELEGDFMIMLLTSKMIGILT